MSHRYAASVVVERQRKGESSFKLCGEPPGSTRAISPRQLPTDHDYAVSTREYQRHYDASWQGHPWLLPSGQ
jgi:hypothetical protein